MTKRQNFSQLTKTMAACAMGQLPAEIVIKNTTLINVNTAEILEDKDIAIHSGRIALVGNAEHCIGEDTKVIDAKGMYAAPGFIDGHIHVESSMMTTSGYAKTVLPHGTTTIFADPHEIANVLGVQGIRFMLEDGRNLPFRHYVVVPSCVPAVEGFEDAGATIDEHDVEELLKDEDVCGLGELMNFFGVIHGDDKMHAELAVTHAAGKTVTGHFSVPEVEETLNAYIATGVRCCHESVREIDALEKMRLGMYAQFREGSAWHDLEEVAKSVTGRNIDSRFACLVSDDTHPHTLINDGHLDHIVKRAIEEGIDPVEAIQMVTINAAQCFHMDKDIGSISPGKCADIVLLSNLENVVVEKVFCEGELVAENGKLTVEIVSEPAPEWTKNTMNIAEFSPEDFAIAAPEGAESVKVRIMESIEAKVGNHLKIIELPVVDGRVDHTQTQGLNKLVVAERHNNTGTMGKGYTLGYGIQGAVASTVAHDAHNLLVMGSNDEDMALAANALRETGGGMVAVQDGRVLALLPLPIAGLMSEESAEDIAAKVDELDKAWIAMGCDAVSPFMTLALSSLAVLPELRITNKGLVDTIAFEFVPLFAE